MKQNIWNPMHKNAHSKDREWKMVCAILCCNRFAASQMCKLSLCFTWCEFARAKWRRYYRITSTKFALHDWLLAHTVDDSLTNHVCYLFHKCNPICVFAHCITENLLLENHMFMLLERVPMFNLSMYDLHNNYAVLKSVLTKENNYELMDKIQKYALI